MTTSEKITLEICASDIDSVYAAAEGGADRVELCSALTEGGLTPSYGLLREALKVDGLKVNVLLRHRNGDFIYSPREMDVMTDDVAMICEAGANAIVFGALNPDGTVDTEACRRIIESSQNMSHTFHRAFDLCRDPFEAARIIESLGFDRILTSGMAASAMEGADTLKELQQAFPALTFIAAGGITPDNAAEIVNRTGIREIHASAKHTVGSSMTSRREGVSMGKPGTDEYARSTTSAANVRDIIKNIKEL